MITLTFEIFRFLWQTNLKRPETEIRVLVTSQADSGFTRKRVFRTTERLIERLLFVWITTSVTSFGSCATRRTGDCALPECEIALDCAPGSKTRYAEKMTELHSPNMNVKERSLMSELLRHLSVVWNYRPTWFLMFQKSVLTLKRKFPDEKRKRLHYFLTPFLDIFGNHGTLFPWMPASDDFVTFCIAS